MMNESTTNGRDGDAGGERGGDAAALYTRYGVRRAERARARTVIDGVLAAIADDEASRGATGEAPTKSPSAALSPRKAARGTVRADRSPEALYRRYRATRTTMPVTTVDAIMTSLQAETGEAASRAESTPEVPAQDSMLSPARPRPSFAGRLFRLPGTLIDALGDSVLARRALPMLALALATVAIVPVLLTRDGPSEPDGARLAVLAPDTLLRVADRGAGYIDALPASGAAFAGEDLAGTAFRLGRLVTDLAVAGSAAASPRLDGVRASLRFVAHASGDEGVANAAETLISSAASPPLTREVLSAPVERLREAVVAAAGGTSAEVRFTLGQTLESLVLAARLAGDGGVAAPLRDALATLASVVRATDTGALPERARELLDELVALDGQGEPDTRGARQVAVTAERLVLLLG